MKTNNNTPEITLKAILLGIVLSMVLAGANAYLGLFAGMTVSASIPAAVISMGVLSLFKKSNILENNIVQTAASAGESLAAGVIFTIPALVLLGYWENFNYLEVAKIAAIGGVIGVLFTVPLRRALIINAKLKYPEGVATAEVLQAGENARQGTKATDGGLKLIGITGLFGALIKLFQSGFGLWSSDIAAANVISAKKGAIFGIGSDLSPALISVGYIVGRNIGILVVGGGLISWAVAIPIYSAIYGFEGEPLSAAWEIWDSKIRYLGVGAMVVGGIWSLVKLFKPLIEGIKASLNALKNRDSGSDIAKEENDIPINYVGIALLVLIIPVFMLYLDIVSSVGIAALLSIVMMVFGFLFSAVAAYMAGVVGSSNNPVSGVTIATILFASLLLLALLGAGSGVGAASAVMVGAVVCCAAAIGGDNLQDLKAGNILGATPYKQQIMQIIGTVSSAVVLGLVLDILHTAYTIGSPTLSAPQATLMKSVSDGVFTGNLPWNFVFIGGIIAIVLILIDLRQEKIGSDFRVPVLAVAVGIYLPITLTVPIFIGGIGIAGPVFLTGVKDWWPTFYEKSDMIGVFVFISIIFWLYKTVSNKD